MGDVLLELAVFVTKAAVIVVAAACILTVALSFLRGSRPRGRTLTVTRMRDALEGARDIVRASTMKPKELKRAIKARRREQAQQEPERTVYVIDFEGDITASEVQNLRRLISALVGMTGENDEVVVRLESPGGLVPHYGLAASQLQRLRDRGVRLTVCVDKIAASGGYLMACIADRVIAAPFAVIGSIGVVAPVPNLHRLLESHGVDYEEVTAGEFKRTVSLLAEITDEGRAKFREQLEDTHALFKQAVAEHREDIDLGQVATGEYWFGTRALELKLVDAIGTSDDYLLELLPTARLLHLKLEEDRSLRERLGLLAEGTVDRLVRSWLTLLLKARYV